MLLYLYDFPCWFCSSCDANAIFSTGPESGKGCLGFERLNEKENGVPRFGLIWINDPAAVICFCAMLPANIIAVGVSQGETSRGGGCLSLFFSLFIFKSQIFTIIFSGWSPWQSYLKVNSTSGEGFPDLCVMLMAEWGYRAVYMWFWVCFQLVLKSCCLFLFF